MAESLQQRPASRLLLLVDWMGWAGGMGGVLTCNLACSMLQSWCTCMIKLCAVLHCYLSYAAELAHLQEVPYPTHLYAASTCMPHPTHLYATWFAVFCRAGAPA
jgi:hypothetical protein